MTPSDHGPEQDRRTFLGLVGGASGALVAQLASAQDADKPKDEGDEGVSAAEDLMREHGVLKRILLVYREGIRRLGENADFDPAALHDSATIIRSFIEDYHEKLEEEFLFPRFVKAGVQTDLVATLQRQHEAGRVITERTIAATKGPKIGDASARRAVSGDLQKFIRMYEPHEAREDTILFPALRKIISAHEYAALGEDFEDREHKLFGEDGFESMVERVAKIEKTLGIYDLAQFTPS